METKSLKINEIFYSVQGESSWVGHPTVFVRTTGCQLRCHYCDTKYAYFEGQDLSFQQILMEIEKFDCTRVCVTGGEPLLQSDILGFLDLLVERSYLVSIETSGNMDCARVNHKVKKVIDVKTPASGAGGSFQMSNLICADAKDEFKFVLAAKEDFTWAEEFCRRNNLFEKSNVFYSPSYNVIDPRWLAEQIIASQSKARMQLQLHKIIWPEATRGV